MIKIDLILLLILILSIALFIMIQTKLPPLGTSRELAEAFPSQKKAQGLGAARGGKIGSGRNQRGKAHKASSREARERQSGRGKSRENWTSAKTLRWPKLNNISQSGQTSRVHKTGITNDFSTSPEDDFPYKRKFIPKQDILDRFARLKAYKPEFMRYGYKIYHMPWLNQLDLAYLPQGEPLLLKTSKNDYLDYNEFTDYFIEGPRVRAKRLHAKMSTFEYWQENREKLLAEFAELMGQNPKKAMEQMRENVYNNTKEVGNFRLTILPSFIERYGAKKILDPCIGWGDRLASAMAKDVELYVGTDPNLALKPGHSEMISMLKNEGGSKTRVELIYEPFEEATLPNETFDLVLTSPPYFNLETYSDEANQSITKYSGFESWLNNFLFVMLHKSWAHLANGGHMIIVINQFPGVPKFIDRMINYVNSFSDSIYLGVVSYGNYDEDKLAHFGAVKNFRDYDRGNYQPMWIWRKQRLDFDWPIVIGQANFGNGKINVVRDDKLIGGTKQRAYKMFADVTQRELVYAGPATGCAQIALAIIAKKYSHEGNSKLATVFLSQLDNPLTARARMLGAKIMYVRGQKGGLARLKDLRESANKYVGQKPDERYACPFGFDSAEFKESLYNDLLAKWPRANTEPSRMWVVAGSASLLAVLYRLFPNTYFNVVQVGKKIWPDQLDQSRTKLYIAPEKFWEKAKEQPPYNTVKTYDAKLWQFVLKEGQAGDYVWNVCGDSLDSFIGGDGAKMAGAILAPEDLFLH